MTTQQSTDPISSTVRIVSHVAKGWKIAGGCLAVLTVLGGFIYAAGQAASDHDHRITTVEHRLDKIEPVLIEVEHRTQRIDERTKLIWESVRGPK